VLVSSYQITGAGDEEPLDQVSLRFAKIELEYAPTGPSGKLESPIKAGWDLKANKKI
jgi:type VI protein secretion system component Hcp